MTSSVYACQVREGKKKRRSATTSSCSRKFRARPSAKDLGFPAKGRRFLGKEKRLCHFFFYTTGSKQPRSNAGVIAGFVPPFPCMDFPWSVFTVKQL